jgi:PKD repeat protein
MNKKILLIILFFLVSILSVLFFTGYFPKFEIVGPVTWYFRNDLTLSTTPTNSLVYKQADRPSGTVYFCVDFNAYKTGSVRLLARYKVCELPPQQGIVSYFNVNFNKTIYSDERIQVVLYFTVDDTKFLDVQFLSPTLNASWFSVNGQLWYTIDSSYDAVKGKEVVKIEYGTNNQKITGVSYFKLPPPPTASFTYSPTSPTVADTISFDASSSTGTNITSYTWDFYMPNGTLYKSVTENDPYTSMILPVVGSWTVKLTVKDIYGQTGTTSQTVSVSAYPLSVDFSWSPSNPYDYDTVTFTATINAKYGVKSILWNFGDGSTASTNPASHVYTKNGTYIVSVTVTDNNDKQASVSKQVIVSYYTISVDFSYSPSNPAEGDDITFTATYSSKYSIIRMSWSFGDGSSDNANPTHHSYSNGGVYSVSFTVVDSNNKQASITKQINVLYVVKFVETGLPSGINWKVVFNNVEKSSSSELISFTANAGTFSYTVESLDVKYAPNPSSGSITVPNIKTVSILFNRQPLTDVEFSGLTSVPVNATETYTLKPKIKDVVQPNYNVKVEFKLNGELVDSLTVCSDSSGVASFTYVFKLSGVYSLDFYDADLSVYVKSVSITVKVKLEIVSETQLTQTYNLEGDYDFNAIFRIRDSCTKAYTNDFDVKSINLTDSSLNIIPIEWYKENFSIYVKAKVYKFYGKAEDKSLRLFFELSSTNHIGVSYSLTVKMVKPVIVIYMLDDKGQVVKGFVKGTNIFYLKFQGISNIDPRDINLTVIDSHGVKHYVSTENIVPAGADSVRVTYSFEEIGTYVFLVDYHGVVETSQTFTYQVVEPYNFFRWDNPIFVALVIVIIAVMYSLVKRKKE